MDKKKLLLVAASVGMFLVIVMGAAILVFTPQGRSGAETAFSENTPLREGGASGTDGTSAGFSNGTAPIPPGYVPLDQNAAPPLAPGYPSAGSAYPNAYQMQDGAAIAPYETPESPRPPLRDRDDRAVISIPSPENAGVPHSGSYPERSPVQKQVVQKSAPPPSVKSTPVSKPAATARIKPAPKANYWVQTGSYAQKSYADTAKEYLSTKGITSIVLNSSVNGKTYYRVRVGPYISKNEAGYWLSLIKTIEGMENSQIWESGS